MADAVATRLREAGVAGRTVTLKVRFARLPDHHPVADRARARSTPGSDRGPAGPGAPGRGRLRRRASACWA